MYTIASNYNFSSKHEMIILLAVLSKAEPVPVFMAKMLHWLHETAWVFLLKGSLSSDDGKKIYLQQQKPRCNVYNIEQNNKIPFIINVGIII